MWLNFSVDLDPDPDVDLGSVFHFLITGRGTFYMLIDHHGSTLQRPWRSLRSLTTLVTVYFRIGNASWSLGSGWTVSYRRQGVRSIVDRCQHRTRGVANTQLQCFAAICLPVWCATNSSFLLYQYQHCTVVDNNGWPAAMGMLSFCQPFSIYFSKSRLYQSLERPREIMV